MVGGKKSRRRLAHAFYCVGAAVCVFGPVLTRATEFGSLPKSTDWSGFYVGGGAGGIWGEQTGEFTTGAAAAANGFPAYSAGPQHPLRGNSGDGVVGLNVGYNFQNGPIVLGAELDVAAIGYDSNFAISPNPSTPDFRYGGIHPEYAYFNQKAAGLGELRGRAGYSTGALLLFVSGGLAITNTALKSYFPGDDAISTAFPNGFPASIASQSATLVGYTIGAGFDYKLSERWALGLEYQHIGFASGSYGLGQRAVQGRSMQSGFLPPVDTFSYAPVSASSGWRADIAMLKLSYFLAGK